MSKSSNIPDLASRLEFAVSTGVGEENKDHVDFATAIRAAAESIMKMAEEANNSLLSGEVTASKGDANPQSESVKCGDACRGARQQKPLI